MNNENYIPQKKPQTRTIRVKKVETKKQPVVYPD